MCLAVAVLHDPALAAPPTLQSFAGGAGGVPSGVNIPGVCNTFGPPAPIGAFFPSGVIMAVPAGGIVACGYVGGLSDVTGPLGPLSSMQSVPPVMLGPGGGTYEGGAEAIADYRTMKASAGGTLAAQSGSALSLSNATGAALFDDILTVTSPQISNGSVGFVRYTFSLEGSLQTPGPPNGIQGQAGAALSLQHRGVGFTIVRVDTSRGNTGTVTSRDHAAGSFVAGVGSISGNGSFTSALATQSGFTDETAFFWGQPFEVKAGLQATVLGNGDADFSTVGAVLTGMQFFDAGHTVVNEVSIASASGTSYGTCTYTITPTSQQVGPAGGGGTVAVATQAGCAWTAVSNTGFVTVTGGAGGKGNGTVSYSVAAGAGAPRSGTLTVAGQTLTIDQVTTCTFAIAPTSKSFGAGGGTGSVVVTAPLGCAWTATSNDAFVKVIGGATGSGSGAAQYSVETNTGAARQGTLTVAGKTFTVSQDGGGPVVINVTERIGVRDAVGAVPPVAIAVTEAVGVRDAATLVPPVTLAVLEAIGVGDAPRATPPVSISVAEHVGVGDASGATPPVAIRVAEGVGVTDAPGAAPPASIRVAESVGVGDATGATPPATIGVAESVGVGDATGATPPATISVTEHVGVGDTPGSTPPAIISVVEGIAVGELHGATPPAIIGVIERIGVGDAPNSASTTTTATRATRLP